ncbi:MAG: transcription initiation factor IIB family protein [Candidatus Sigynarchaeum springense]
METRFAPGSKSPKDQMDRADETCPECNNPCLIEDSRRGELVCTSCGAVIEGETFDFSERRAFSEEEVEKRRHNGAPITALTDIAWTNILKATSKNASPTLKRAARWNSCLNWEKKSLLVAITEIKRVCSALGVPRIVAETAATYFRKIQKRNVLRGRSIHGFIGGCIYLACRTSHVPRSVDDIYKEMPGTADRDIRIGYGVLVTELKVRVPRLSAVALLPRFSSMLNLKQDTLNLAERMLVALEKRNNTTGKDPKGMIAAVIYIACKIKGEETSQKRVAAACSVTEVTIRSRLKEINAILPESIKL